jgi:hypothetical protein
MEERNGFRLDRLRLGEWIIGGASLALMIDVLLPWYSLASTFHAAVQFGQATHATATQAHNLLGPFTILCAIVGLVCWALQATRRGPALPQTFTVITSVLSFILCIALVFGVVIDPPVHLLLGDPEVHTTRTDLPAVLGVFLAVLLFAGTWLSLRTDGSAAADAPQRIETLRITQRSA